jgi:hypothetical protein
MVVQVAAALRRVAQEPGIPGIRGDIGKRDRRVLGLEPDEGRHRDIGQAGDLAAEELCGGLEVPIGGQAAQRVGDEDTLADEPLSLGLEFTIVADVAAHIHEGGDRAIRRADG